MVIPGLRRHGSRPDTPPPTRTSPCVGRDPGAAPSVRASATATAGRRATAVSILLLFSSSLTAPSTRQRPALWDSTKRSSRRRAARKARRCRQPVAAAYFDTPSSLPPAANQRGRPELYHPPPMSASHKKDDLPFVFFCSHG